MASSEHTTSGSDRTMAQAPPDDTAAYHTRVAPPVPGTPRVPVVPGYEILGELGRGGMGVVYKARQEGLNRIVAIKTMRVVGPEDSTGYARFRFEAEAVALLQHPGIAQVFEVGSTPDSNGEEHPFMVMEFVDGVSLQQLVKKGLPDPARAAALVEELARAVHFAHARGVVHRDLKPANVLLTADGKPKVVDFGLAKKLDTDMHVTHTGAILGTPSYMSPEQAFGKSNLVTTLSDVYSLGAILYDLLSGRPPFVGVDVMDTLMQVRTATPEPPSHARPEVSRDLDTIALKALEKDPALRYASAGAMADDLGRWSRGEPIGARPPTLGTLVRGWIKQNFGAFGWTLPLGVLYGFAASLLLWSVGGLPMLAQRSAVYDALPSLEKPFGAFVFQLPRWFELISIGLGMSILSTTGLATVAIVRPRNRAADIAAGLATGITFAMTFFACGAGWWFCAQLAVRPGVDDLMAFEAAADPTGRERLLARYPELADMPPDAVGRLLTRKILTDIIIRLPASIANGVAFSVVLCIVFSIVCTAIGGEVLRRSGGPRAAILPYLELCPPVSLAVYSIFDGFWLAPVARGYAIYAIYCVLFAIPALSAAWVVVHRKPLATRLVFHALWLAAWLALSYHTRIHVYNEHAFEFVR